MISNYEELKDNVNILLVDDDLDYIQVTAFFLKSKGYKVDIATSGVEAVDKVRKGDVHIALLDYYMPGLTGEDVINQIRQFNDKIIIILQTGFSGQQPPEETLQKLDIQNYHDKADGADKLLLEVMSAVRIFDQQNKVALSEYRVKTVGRLIKGIAEELKSPLLSIGAGIEATKVLIDSAKTAEDKELAAQVDKLYTANKDCLKKIDKILSTLIFQSANSSHETMKVADMIEIFEYMINNEVKLKNIRFIKDVGVDENEYLIGDISDLIFILCELIHKTVDASRDSDEINFSVKDSENAWYLAIKNDSIESIDNMDLYLIRSILSGINGISLECFANQFVIQLSKTI